MGCLSLNRSHGSSISRGGGARRPASGFRFGARELLVILPLLGMLTPVSARASCADALAHPAFSAGPLTTLGTTPATTNLALAPTRTYLIEVEERDNDALVELLDSSGKMLARADHPERRSGTRRAIVPVPQTGSITLRITGKEHANVTGTATARAYDLGSIRSPECVAVFDDLAAADGSYAVGQDISRGRVPAAGRSARDAYLRAAEGYTAAEVALTATDDRQMRGETALAISALYLFDLFDWGKAEEWAKGAAATLEADDPYRHARAEALMAYAWVQVGQSESVRQAATLLDEARELLQRVSRFHTQRGESYDAAVQLPYVALTYLYQGRYSECVAASVAAGRVFGSMHDVARVAQASQNRALCLWGLGRLSEARDGFEHLLGEIDPQAAHGVYVAVVTNTALLDYSLGNYDESLRLYDRALAVAEQTQHVLDAARCLYGIGVNYRALGDPERARDFLERSLIVRTVALDGRGRMDTLRALAIVDAEQGRLEEAVGFDREALTLAVDPLASESIRVQLASHIARAGHPEEGKALLDEVLSKGPRGDPIILAQALVQRAIILRGMGRSQDALGDLAQALQRFHALGSVNGEFATDIELARTLRLAGRTRDALAAVERALAQGDTVRLQSVNPDFRTQLEAPLRAAYDLKIELLHTEYEAAVVAGRSVRAAELAIRAFAAADSSRARTFSDVAAQEYSPGLRRELAPELRRREAIYRELAERRFALDSLTDLSPVSNPRARHLLSEIADLKRQSDTVNTAIAARAAHPAVPKAGGMYGSVPSIPADSALISFWLGAESSYAWVVLPGAVHWARLASPSLIAEKAGVLHDSLTRLVDRPMEQRLADAARLSDLVIKPLEPWLTGAEQWIIVPDGALDYIPFAALRLTGNPDSYVVLRHDVALTPAAWMLNTEEATSRHSDERALLLVADPVYQPDDPRLAAVPKAAAAHSPGAVRSADSGGYRRLAYTAQEAATIRREFLSAEVDELTGLEATRERLLTADLSRYRFIHIATHGSVDTRVPELSALVLGSYDARGNLVDGAVRVPDLALQTLHAEVVVFSACDTALGKEVASEGLVGIGSTVLARGARAVVASLWPVSDEMGARLMTEFYRHLLRDSMSAPAALAAAMRTVVSRERAADPALWAAYQVSVVALGPGRPSRNGGLRVSTTSAEGGTL
jgi:CHAT domain-containing protein/tetratricopeptide (TPR) repeat protein